MRPMGPILGIEKRKKGKEKEIKELAQSVKGNKGRVEYISALMKDIYDFIIYLDAIVNRLEGTIGVEQHIFHTILKTLAEQKRTVITMTEILSNVPQEIASKIKKEIANLNKFIKDKFEEAIKNEGRVYKGKYTRSHYFDKLFGNMQKDVDIYRELQLVAREEKIEIAEEARFTEEVESLRERTLSALPHRYSPGVGHEGKFEKMEQLEDYGADAIRILRYYRREFEQLFKSLGDIQEQDLRNIKLIDHYLKLLEELKKDRRLKVEYDLNALHKKLTDIKTKLKLYIRRDFRQDINANALFEQFSNRIEQVEASLVGIEKIPLQYPTGEVYYKKINGQLPKKGIVFVPGTSRDHKQYEPIIYRLVLEGYLVCAFDLPSQGTIGHLRVGLISDYIYRCVMYVRSEGIVEVGVVAHSLGAMATICALGGYNEELENYIINVASKYIEKLKDEKNSMIARLKKLNLTDYGDVKEIEKKINTREIKIHQLVELFEERQEDEQAYLDFRTHIFTALKKTRFLRKNLSGMIDAVVLLASPASIQSSKIMHKWAFKLSPENFQRFVNGLERFDRLGDLVFKRQLAIDYKLQSSSKKDLDKLQYGTLQVKKSDWPDFLKYLQESPNPFDFMSLLDYFSKFPNFEKLYIDYLIRNVPKIFLFGTKDLIIGGSYRKGILEKAYHTMVGPTTTIHPPYPGVGHIMAKMELGGLKKRGYMVTSPIIQRDIIVFLRTHLNPRMKLIREVT